MTIRALEAKGARKQFSQGLAEEGKVTWKDSAAGRGGAGPAGQPYPASQPYPATPYFAGAGAGVELASPFSPFVSAARSTMRSLTWRGTISSRLRPFGTMISVRLTR